MAAARVVSGEALLGSGFAIAPRLALTANHVVRERDPSSVRFVLAGGRALAVERIEGDASVDVAVLHLAEDVPASEVRTLGRAREGAAWRAEAQPTDADAFLTGTIKALLWFVNARGHHTQAIQLLVDEVLGEYEGYSGSPVALDESGAVVGVLVEQLRQRVKARPGQPKPAAANVLYASPIQEVLDRFKLDIAIASPPETRLPTSPQNAVPREDERRPITRDLLSDVGAAINGGRRVAVVGMGGTGKTVLAAQVAADPEVRAAFASEVIWLTLDKTPITQHQARLAAALGEREAAFEDWQHGRDVLAKRLSGRACLLVLDNVSEAEELNAFDVLGPRGRLLFTSRYADLAHSYGASVHYLGLFTALQARKLLADWAKCEVAALPPEAEQILALCGGLPLAIAMAGAMVRGRPERWRTVLAKLRAVDPGRIAADLPGYPHSNLLAALDVSVEELDEAGEERKLLAARERYSDLAVFSGRGAVPRPALARMWAGAGVAAGFVDDYVELFVDHSLATTDVGGRLRLHDLQMASVVARARGQLPALHSRLLDSYASASPSSWASLPDDGYILEHLIHHLLHVGRREEAAELLLDYAWIAVRLQATGVSALLADYTLVPDSADVTLIHEALRLSAHILGHDHAQLATQITGRTLRLESAAIRGLREAAEAAAARAGVPWFKVLHPVLHTPGGALVRTIQPPASSTTVIIPRKRWVAARPESDSRYAIIFYDLMSGEVVRQIELDQERPLGDPDDALARFRLHLGLHYTLSAAADGSRLLVVNDDECGCMVFDLTTWECVARCSLKELAAARLGDGVEPDAPVELPEITAAQLLKGGTRAVVAFSDGEVVLADLTSGRAERRYEGLSGRVRLVRVDDGEARLAATTEGAEVVVWDVRSGEQVRLYRGPIPYVKDFAFFGDGRRLLVVGESGAKFEDGEISEPEGTGLVWDVATGEQGVTFTAPEGIVVCALFANDNRCVTGHRGGWVFVWDVTTGACLRRLRAHNSFVAGALVLDERRLLVTASDTWDGSVRLWDMSRERGTEPSFWHQAGRVEPVGFFDDGRKALTVCGPEMKVWDVATGACERTFEHSRWNVDDVMRGGLGPDAPDYSAQLRALADRDPDRIVQSDNSVSYSWRAAVFDQGRRAVSGSARGTIKVWDLQTDDCLLAIPGHSADGTAEAWGNKSVQLATVLTDERRVLTSSWDSTLKLWSLETGECLAEFKGHSSLPDCATLFEDDRRMISGGLDGEVRLWDVTSGECLAVLSGHEDWVQGVAALAGGRYAVSASHDRTLRLWDLTEKRQVARFDGETLMTSLAAAPDGRTLVAGDHTGRVYFLRVEGM